MSHLSISFDPTRFRHSLWCLYFSNIIFGFSYLKERTTGWWIWFARVGGGEDFFGLDAGFGGSSVLVLVGAGSGTALGFGHWI